MNKTIIKNGLIFVAIIIAGSFLFWVLCATHLSANHILIIKNRLTGKYRIEKEQKMYITGPWPFVATGTISTMPFIVRMAPTERFRDNYTDIFFPPKLVAIRSDFSEAQLWEYIRLIGDPTMSITPEPNNSNTFSSAIFSNNVSSFIEIKDPKILLEQQ